MTTFIAAIAFLAIPFVLWLIDVFLSIHSRGVTYKFSDKHNHDYTMLIPIYGQIKYLETVDYLSEYGERVMLLTTGGESEEFMRDIRAVAKKHKFKLFVAEWSGKQDLNKRATSGTIRDRLIRDALAEVTTEYSIPLDADSVSDKNMSVAVGQLIAEGADIASIRLVPSNGDANWLTRMQKFEYRISMDIRQIVPWLISGACQIAKTEVLRDIMQRHSLFFQGNDVEIGILAKRLGYKVVHIPFEVNTALPDKLKPWWRQRLAWAGGEFRLFIVNFRQILHHPFFWFYGAIVVIIGFPLRYLALSSLDITLLFVLGLYIWLVFFLHWRFRSGWLVIMPIYSLFYSLILVPIGIYMYAYMAIKDRNAGVIRPSRTKTAQR